MKLLLVHGKFSNSWESQAMGLIGAYVREHRPDVEVQFRHGNMDPVEDIVAAGADADIVAFSCTSPAYNFAVDVARQIRQVNAGVWTVLGGYHPSAVTHKALCPAIDQVVMGEGEAAMISILDGGRWPVIYGRPMEFSELLWCDRKLIRNERHIDVAAKDTGQRITSFQAHRGCPHRCRFCADGKCNALQGGMTVAVRSRSIHDLLEEIVYVTEEYKLDLIKFCDPTWNSHRRWVHDFCRMKVEVRSKVPFFANIHAGSCGPEMFELMAAAGCSEIGLGIESGSEKVLAAMGKGITKRNVRDVVSWASGVGIRVRGYFILGMPCETADDIKQTGDFAAELDLATRGFTILCPYPGTDFYTEDLADKDWTGIDEYSNDFWHTDTVSNQELRDLQQGLRQRFEGSMIFRQSK